jgi:hypothetical protein
MVSAPKAQTAAGFGPIAARDLARIKVKATANEASVAVIAAASADQVMVGATGIEPVTPTVSTKGSVITLNFRRLPSTFNPLNLNTFCKIENSEYF